MKKIITILITFVLLLGFTGCTKEEKNYALEFKKEYEALNGVVNKNGKEHRTITIS